MCHTISHREIWRETHPYIQCGNRKHNTSNCCTHIHTYKSSFCHSTMYPRGICAEFFAGGRLFLLCNLFSILRIIGGKAMGEVGSLRQSRADALRSTHLDLKYKEQQTSNRVTCLKLAILSAEWRKSSAWTGSELGKRFTKKRIYVKIRREFTGKHRE